MDDDNITPFEIKKFIETKGKKALKLISLLGLVYPTFEACNTSVGKTILKEDIDRMEYLFEKIVNEEASEIEKAEFKYLNKTRLPSVLGKIENYFKAIGEVKKTIGVSRIK